MLKGFTNQRSLWDAPHTGLWVLYYFSLPHRLVWNFKNKLLLDDFMFTEKL